MSKWQPIETAPKDGKWFLITEETGTWMDVVRWSDGAWRSWPDTVFTSGDETLGRTGSWQPSHWRHLPEPPND